MRFQLFTILLLVNFISNAQIVNFEKFRPNVDTSNVWSLALDAGLDLKQKTSASTNLKFNAGTYYLSERNAYYFLANYGFTRVNGTNIFEHGYVHVRTVLNRRKKVAYEPFVQIQYDLGKGLKRRGLLGGNIRFNFYKKSKAIFAMGTGVFYENEDWIERETLNTLDNINVKSNNYISSRWILSDWMKFYLTGYYQAPYHDFIRSRRVIVDSNLQMDFTDNLSYQMKFKLASDQNPVVETARLTYLFSTGFRYSF